MSFDGQGMETHARGVVPHARGVVETLLSTASDPVTSVLLPQWGSILLLVRALAPYNTLLL